MNRRQFLKTSAIAAGGMAIVPSMMAMVNEETGIKLVSPMDMKFRIKVINDGIVHEDAWEGSCRFGNLEHLTYEAEMNFIQGNMRRLRERLASMDIPKEVEMLEPVTMYSWVEKANPDIMLPEEQLRGLASDADITDLYVVSSPYMGYRIAERYRKPIVVLQPNGWGVDGPAGIRQLGLQAYHVKTWEEMFEYARLFYAQKVFANTKLLSVTNFPGRVPWGVVSAITDLDAIRERYGMDSVSMDYKEFFGFMDKMEKDRAMQRLADRMADELLSKAGSSNMTRESIAKSAMFHITVAQMLDKQSCNAFTIECFELCSSKNPWRRQFTPCLNNALLKDAGIPAACEGDINALLAMMVQKYLSNKSIYMGNPDVYRNSGELKIHHSVAGLKMFGIDEEPTPYNIQSFMVAGHGATLRHDFAKHIGEKVTVGRFDPSGTKMLMTAGEVVDGGGMDGCGCAQSVEMKIPNARALWRASQNYGHHLSFVYGDYTRQIEDLGDLMGFEVEHIT